MPLDWSEPFGNKLLAAMELEYASVQDRVIELLKYRKMIAEMALKTDYPAHKELVTRCNQQLKKILSL